MKYLILAGGSGTRLWPLSRKYYSKQFLSLINEYSMLQNTALRVSKENGKDIFVITTEDSFTIINKQLSSIFLEYPKKNILLEPEGKNTCPAIAYSSIFFDNEDVIAVLSSDHHIENTERFNEILDEAEKIAKEGYIVTLGIVPNLPKTGYGYIEKTDIKIGTGYKVNRFVEKPDIKKAEEYLQSGNFFWNAGIFIFKISTFMEELNKHASLIYNITMKVKEKTGSYNEYPNISIDYALMEKSDRIVVIPADIGWSDIGSFFSLYEFSKKDENLNVIRMEKENFINFNSNNLFVWSDKRLIATIDVNNLAIIDTEDALLISNLNSSEKVKNVAQELEKKRKNEFFYNNKRFYEWGYIVEIEKNSKSIIQKIIIDPFRNTENILLKFNSKTITCIKGEVTIEKENEIIKIKESDSIIIKKGISHKIVNSSNSLVELIEVISRDIER